MLQHFPFYCCPFTEVSLPLPKENIPKCIVKRRIRSVWRHQSPAWCVGGWCWTLSSSVSCNQCYQNWQRQLFVWQGDPLSEHHVAIQERRMRVPGSGAGKCKPRKVRIALALKIICEFMKCFLCASKYTDHPPPPKFPIYESSQQKPKKTWIITCYSHAYVSLLLYYKIYSKCVSYI